MKVTLIKQFKNHPAGSELDVSHRIYDHLRDLGCVEDLRPVEFGPDVVEAAQKVGTKKERTRKPKALNKPPSDRMVREAETK